MEIQIRTWKPEDAAALAEQANNEKVTEHLRNVFPHPYTEEDAQFFINGALRTHCDRAWVRAIEVDGKIAGGITLTFGDDVYSKNGELGYWLGESYWNRGIATRAVAELCERAFRETDLVRIEAEVLTNNPASIRVLEKDHFQREGYFCNRVCKNDQLIDSVVFALLK